MNVNRSFHVKTLEDVKYEDAMQEVTLPKNSVCLAQDMTDEELARFPKGSVWVFFENVSWWLKPNQFERYVV